MVKGRLPRESNPVPGKEPGFVASHDTTGAEDYKRTSPLNPLPVKSIGDSNVKDAAVKAELELIKQGIADNKATNDLILEKLDSGVSTQLTGSKVEYMELVENEIVASNSSGTFSTSAGAVDGVREVTFYISANVKFKADLYVYDGINLNLAREYIEIASHDNPAIIRPNIKSIEIPLTKRLAVIMRNQSAEDMTCSINLGLRW